ncbi:hypothetical protein M2390_000597 [Mycetocola sp. BIGb0189]|nr:hypothetical protein [Mycetocola sp. BIGb0189]
MRRVPHSATFSRVMAICVGIIPLASLMPISTGNVPPLWGLILLMGTGVWCLAIIIFTGLYVSATEILVVGIFRVTRLSKESIAEISHKSYEPLLFISTDEWVLGFFPRTLVIVDTNGRTRRFNSPVFRRVRGPEILQSLGGFPSRSGSPTVADGERRARHRRVR